MSIISKFNVFSEIDQQLVKNIKLFYLNKYYLLFVLSDNSLFHYDLRDKKPPKMFESFCENQFIIKLDGSNDPLLTHYLALTDKNCVYSWGRNTDRQLANKTYIDCDEPKLIVGLRNTSVTDVCCGVKHSLVITRYHKLFAFGSNLFGQCGTGSDNAHQTVPVKIEILNVTAISCGGYHSLALTRSGDVFGWGDNSDGQLGLADTLIQSVPKQLSVAKIKQIMCGKRFTLMLYEDKDIYFCGKIEKTFMISKPTKINSETTKFIEIGASISSDLCVALSEDSKCFIFGKYKNEVMKELKQTETDITSIEDAYALYEQITCKIIRNASRHENFIELGVIGSGGFGTVLKCQCKADNKVYAIKKVSFESGKRETVYNELKFLSQLDSKFVVEYVDSWVEKNYYKFGSTANKYLLNVSSTNTLYQQNLPYVLHIQMELCSLTLRDAIKILVDEWSTNKEKTHLLSYYIRFELFYELIECVQYLHKRHQPIIHRDLKPENFLINFRNNRFLKLCDFGLSTFHEYADQSHTAGYMGTPKYIAPEIMTPSTTKLSSKRGAKMKSPKSSKTSGKLKSNYTTQADCYSLGIILQELFHFDISTTRRRYLPVLKPKMDTIKLLTDKLYSRKPKQRPTCDAMLSILDSSRLPDNEIKADKSLMQIITNSTNSYSIDTKFIEFFIYNKYNFNTRPQTNEVEHQNKKQNFTTSRYFSANTNVIADNSNKKSKEVERLNKKQKTN